MSDTLLILGNQTYQCINEQWYETGLLYGRYLTMPVDRAIVAIALGKERDKRTIESTLQSIERESI